MFLRFLFQQAGVHVNNILYLGYGIVGTGVYLLLHLFLPLLKHLGKRYSYGLEQRLGLYDDYLLPEIQSQKRLWLHAASVGEVRAAVIVAEAFLQEIPGLSVVLTTTTEQGNKIAKNLFPDDIPCLMAPLDVPIVVARALQKIAPDVYVCLETELWPVMLSMLRKKGIAAALLNGRLSERSLGRYLYLKTFMSQLLQGFQWIATITKEDASRFSRLGAVSDRVQVCGNVKSAMGKNDIPGRRNRYRQILQVGVEKVFVCGSTHSGEEEQLIPVYQRFSLQRDLLWVIVPRHLERIKEVAELLLRAGLQFHYYIELKNGGKRTHPVVLVNTMGDLVDLYSAGDYNFCGGSLVKRGGHNILEAVQQERPVYYGPFMNDFRQEADLLESAGCGFPVIDADQLACLLQDHDQHQEKYKQACKQAKNLVLSGAEIVEKQINLVKDLFEKKRETGL